MKKLTKSEYQQLKTLKEMTQRHANLNNIKQNLEINFCGRIFRKSYIKSKKCHTREWIEVFVDKTGKELTNEEKKQMTYAKRNAKLSEIETAREEKRKHLPVEFNFKGVTYICYPIDTKRGWTKWYNKKEHEQKLKVKQKWEGR